MSLGITTGLLNDLRGLEDSTTLFLEYVSGRRLRVQIESQWEEDTASGPVIRRITTLFFDSPDYPVLYCTSSLRKDQLTHQEYQLLTGQSIPIGRVFLRYNDAREIRKENISLVMEVDETAASRLQVGHSLLCKKQYDYRVSERGIGQITEMFNEESLYRSLGKP